MTAAAILSLAIKASLALTVLSVGLQATPGDGQWLFRRPALLARSLLSMNVMMPLVALYVAVGFDLRPPVKLGLLAMAISPVPPFLASKEIKHGGEASYAVGLAAAVSLLSILFVPASVYVLSALLATPVRMSPRVVAILVGESILLPLAVGLIVRRLAPAFSVRVAKPIAKTGVVVLTIAVIPLLIAVWPTVKLLVGNGTLVAMVLVTMAGLGVGHVLGGPALENRLVLALSTASRHPAVAIAIAEATFPGDGLVTTAVLLELVVVTLVSAPYISHIKREVRAVRERDAIVGISGQTPLGTRTPHFVDRRARR